MWNPLTLWILNLQYSVWPVPLYWWRSRNSFRSPASPGCPRLWWRWGSPWWRPWWWRADCGHSQCGTSGLQGEVGLASPAWILLLALKRERGEGREGYFIWGQGYIQPRTWDHTRERGRPPLPPLHWGAGEDRSGLAALLSPPLSPGHRAEVHSAVRPVNFDDCLLFPQHWKYWTSSNCCWDKNLQRWAPSTVFGWSFSLIGSLQF